VDRRTLGLSDSKWDRSPAVLWGCVAGVLVCCFAFFFFFGRGPRWGRKEAADPLPTPWQCAWPHAAPAVCGRQEARPRREWGWVFIGRTLGFTGAGDEAAQAFGMLNELFGFFRYIRFALFCEGGGT